LPGHGHRHSSHRQPLLGIEMVAQCFSSTSASVILWILSGRLLFFHTQLLSDLTDHAGLRLFHHGGRDCVLGTQFMTWPATAPQR